MKKVSSKLREMRMLASKAKFKCHAGCCECCGAIDMTEEEFTRIRCYARTNGIVPKQAKGKEMCEWLDEDGRCQIYEERPMICRIFGKYNHKYLICEYHPEYATEVASPEIEKYFTTSNHKNTAVYNEETLAGYIAFQEIRKLKNGEITIEECIRRLGIVGEKTNVDIENLIKKYERLYSKKCA